MNIVTIEYVTDFTIKFSKGYKMYSHHEQDCCEMHYIHLLDLTPEDYAGLEFDLDSEYFERIEGYGIALKPINGHPLRIPCYGYNNGYYSHELTLILEDPDGNLTGHDITKCQEIRA